MTKYFYYLYFINVSNYTYYWDKYDILTDAHNVYWPDQCNYHFLTLQLFLNFSLSDVAVCWLLIIFKVFTEKCDFVVLMLIVFTTLTLEMQ